MDPDENTDTNGEANVEAGAAAGQAAGPDMAELQKQLTGARQAQAGSDRQVTDLQKQLGDMKTALDAKQAAAQELTQQHDDETATRDTALLDMRAQIATLIKENERRQKAEAAAKYEAEVAGLVVNEFPGLGDLLASGAMPAAANLDELREKLTTIKNLVNTKAELSTQKKIEGMRTASPSATGAGDGSTHGLNKKLELAAAAKNWELYSQLSAQWNDLHKE